MAIMQLSFPAHFVTNPSLTKKGLTIATKIKISNEALGYVYPRFLVDSGGMMGDGVSMYINDQTLFCEVAAGDARWKVYSCVLR